jgi:hypothetical protein
MDKKIARSLLKKLQKVYSTCALRQDIWTAGNRANDGYSLFWFTSNSTCDIFHAKTWKEIEEKVKSLIKGGTS